MAACVNGGDRGAEAGREEKLARTSALLIAEMKYNLFRNMQIQQSLCLVYRRDLLIQREREETERERISQTDSSISCINKHRRQQLNSLGSF